VFLEAQALGPVVSTRDLPRLSCTSGLELQQYSRAALAASRSAQQRTQRGRIEPAHRARADDGDGNGAPSEPDEFIVRPVVLVHVAFDERVALA
jgi:hypothetical protein